MAIITNVAYNDANNTSIKITFDDGSFYHQTVGAETSPFQAMIDQWLLNNVVSAYIKPVVIARKEINAVRDQAYSHLDVPFTMDNGDVHFICAGDKGRNEIVGAVVNILVAIQMGVPETPVTWTTDADADVDFTWSEFMRMGATVAQAYGDIHRSARAQKAVL